MLSSSRAIRKTFRRVPGLRLRNHNGVTVHSVTIPIGLACPFDPSEIFELGDTPVIMAPLNPLMSTQKTTDSGLQVALHPLVLLTVSDYVTRHTLRQQTGPVVGALLGQQNGREITIEHAFDCRLVELEGDIILHREWFEERLQQMKDVHKVPALDLVGWYTILPQDGPQAVQLPIHRQIISEYNESAILLGFHPTAVLDGPVGGKLPITIYESNWEAEEKGAEAGEDKKMEDGDAKLGLRFKVLPYTVETGEAEMISVDFVARGGGNATAVDDTSKKAAPTDDPKSKGKTRASNKSDESSASTASTLNILSREEEELLAQLTARVNAIKMLKTRIELIATYLRNLPPSYVNGASPQEGELADAKYTPVNHAILRSIQALLIRLSIIIPADSKRFEQELLAEQNDVSLINLLSTITNSINDAREIGKKSQIIENGKSSSRSKGGMLGGGPLEWSGGSSGVIGVGDLIS